MLLVLTFAAILVVLVVISRKYWLPSTRLGLGGPPGKLVLGNVVELSNAALNGTIPMFIEEAIIHHGGDAKTVGLALPGGKTLIATANAKEIRDILVTKSDSYAITMPTLKDVVPNGLISLQGDQWKRHRKLVSAAFRDEPLSYILQVINDECDLALPHWEHMSNGDWVNMFSELSKFALDVVAQSSLSIQLKSVTSNEFDEFHRAAVSMTRELQIRGFVPKALYRFFGVKENQLKDDVGCIKSMIRKALASRSAAQKIEESKGKKNDLLDMLMNAKEGDEKPLTYQEIEDEIVIFFFAGHETSSNTMCWILYELAKHPEIMERARREVELIIGSRKPEWDDLSKLKYLDMVINEALRLHPPTSVTSRTSVTEVEFAGQTLPPGTEFLICSYALHRDPDNFERPLEFDPQRWENDAVVSQAPYFPFGYGAHLCVGKKLAWTELQVLLCRLLQKYTVALNPYVEVEECMAATLGPKQSGLYLKLVPHTLV